ncbi:hypothetical protein LCGC14_2913980, partial [marine sediment metagenome]
MGKWVLRHIVEGIGYADSECEDYDRYMLGRFGGGRGKKTWAERIGKKYQWIGLHRLAARLADHVPLRRSSHDPEPLRTPLLLAQERQIDPTLPPDMCEAPDRSAGWWITSGWDPERHRPEDDETWVGLTDDLPDTAALLSPITCGDQRWLLLQAFPTWDDRSPDDGHSKPYRYVWLHLRGYLVPSDAFERAIGELTGQNFFGRWMPEGGSFLYGFAGEYPWATPFNTEPESYLSSGGRRELPFPAMPISSQVVAEWEYDA